MSLYHLAGDGVFQTEKMFFVPNQEKNRDWQVYLNWANSNTPDNERTLSERRILRIKEAERECIRQVQENYDIQPEWTPSQMTMYISAMFVHLDALIVEINISTDPESIDILTGWPSY